MHNPGCNKKDESVFNILASTTFRSLSLPCLLHVWATKFTASTYAIRFQHRREVEIFQTPNSRFKLSAVHSIATLRPQSTLSAWLWFLSRPNLRPSPWRILLLFTMWIICFISHHRCLCVLHSNIYKFFISGVRVWGGAGRGLFNVQKIPGAKIKHWAEFQRPWFNKWREWRFESRTTNPQLNKYPRSTCYRWYKDHLNHLHSPLQSPT